MLLNLYSIVYESDEQYDLDGERFKWVAETITNNFEFVKGAPQYCKYVIVERDRLEFVVIRELIEFVIRYFVYFKYANLDSDVFEYISSMELKSIRFMVQGV